MKYKYIVASALSLAVVGASIISPFSDSAWIDENFNNLYESIDWFSNWVSVLVGEQWGQYACIVLSKYGDETTYHINVKSSTYTSGSNPYTTYYFDHYYIENPSDTHSFNDRGQGYVRVYNDHIEFNYENYYFWGSDKNVVYCDLPETYGNSSSQTVNPMINTIKNSYPQKIHGSINNSSTFSGNLGLTLQYYAPPTPTPPPYTDSAPNFPNLPDNWVNGDGNTYNIDLPDFDFNIDLPSYTMPEAVSIPADIVQKSSSLYQIPLNIIDRYGLWWLVGLSLICTVITLILNR